jgi:hypothetical protein
MPSVEGPTPAQFSDAFRYDLFISYAHGLPGPNGDGPLKRWSRQFRDLLEENLSFLSGSPARIFFDDGSRADESLDPLATLETQFGEKLAQSAMLQVHMSKYYLRSKWCGRELARWLESLPDKVGGPDRRISVVRLSETGDIAWPDALAPSGTQLPGNRFHDRESELPWGFGRDFSTAPTEAFNAELITTAGVIHRRLTEIREAFDRRAAEAAQVRALDAGTSGVRSVYLHGRQREKEIWSRTAEELTRLDVEVQPFQPAPDDDEGETWNTLSKVASRCEAMLLVSADPFELGADLDMIGRERRNYIQSKFRKFLPCAVVDRTGLKNDLFLRAAKLRGIDWLDAQTPGWGGSFQSWLVDAAKRTAAKYGIDPAPPPPAAPAPAPVET